VSDKLAALAAFGLLGLVAYRLTVIWGPAACWGSC